MPLAEVVLLSAQEIRATLVEGARSEAHMAPAAATLPAAAVDGPNGHAQA